MGKKNKPKLTPEEKKALKLEKKLAKKLQLEEGKRQAKRDYLIRELQYGRLNRQKLEKSLQNMLLSIKLPALQIEFQLAVNHVERIMDSKDFIISFLLDELDDAEEQYNMNLSSHVSNTDNILGIYQQRLDDLKHKYDDEYANLIKAANDEADQLKLQIETESQHLNTMIYRLEHEKKEMDKELRSDYLSKLNEETSRNIDELGLFTQSRERMFENIWESYKDTLHDYTESTRERQKEYNVLSAHDTFMTNLIKEQTSQLYHLQRKLLKLKDLQLCEKEDLDKNVEFKINEKNFLIESYQKLRNHFDVDWKYDKQKLIHMVIASSKSIKCLERAAKHCESVINIYALSQKLETQREKFLPFPKQLPAQISIKYKRILSDLKVKVKLQTELEAFWMKCAQGDTLRNNIYAEREHLKKENAYLKQYLSKYCSTTKRGCMDV